MLSRLSATADTVHWGFYDAKREPVLKIRSGDVVELESVTGKPEFFSNRELQLLYHDMPNLKEIYEEVPRGPGPHILTGPIEIKGAEIGDILAVSFNKFEPLTSIGFSLILPLLGTLPENYPYFRARIIRLDAKRKNALFSSRIRVPLSPFFGNCGVAPPLPTGPISSMSPGVHGGNMDNKELVAGSILYLPVHVPGGLFSVGDGHAMQGDGEVSDTALETWLGANLQFEIKKNMNIRLPMAETETHIIFMGFHADLDEAARIAVRNTLDYLQFVKGLDRDEAYTLAGMIVDFHITQLVNGTKGVHALLRKSIFTSR